MTSVANIIVNSSLVEPLNQNFDLIGKSLTVDTIEANNVDVTGEYSIGSVPVIQYQLLPAMSNNFLTGGDNADLQNGSVTGTNNSSLGSYSLNSLTTGSNNSALGKSALDNVTTGSGNVAVGSTSGLTLTTGSNNILLGNASEAKAASDSFELVLGSVTGNGSNTFNADARFFTSVASQTTDASNGKFLSMNTNTGLVSAATEIKFPYVTTSPRYNDVTTATVAPNGTFNARTGIINIPIAASLAGNNDVTILINNNTIGSGTSLMFGVVTNITEANDYYKLYLYRCTAANNIMTFYIQNLTSDATAPNWEISIYFYILN
jgi:hypothetical protein